MQLPLCVLQPPLHFIGTVTYMQCEKALWLSCSKLLATTVLKNTHYAV